MKDTAVRQGLILVFSLPHSGSRSNPVYFVTKTLKTQQINILQGVFAIGCSLGYSFKMESMLFQQLQTIYNTINQPVKTCSFRDFNLWKFDGLMHCCN